MRFFLKALLTILLAILIAGVLTYPVWSLIGLVADYRPDRVMRRIGMIFLAVSLVWILRREGLADRKTFGYGIDRQKFIRQLAIGFCAGLVLMLPLVAGIFSFHLRTITVSNAAIVKLFAEGLLTGFVVAFVEETFMRGAMYSVIERESGIVSAIVLPAILYAAVHFMDGKLRIPSTEMDFFGGLRMAAHTFERFAAPGEILDSFLALFALGVLLAFIRRRTGAIAGGIGVHAGGVCVITMMRNISQVDPSAANGWLVGSYDGVIGWMAFAWITLVTAVYWLNSKAKFPDARRAT